MLDKKPKASGIAIAAKQFSVHWHPFYRIADYLTADIQGSQSQGVDSGAKRKVPPPPAPPTVWNPKGEIGRHIPVVCRKGSAPLLIGERGLFLLAQQRDGRILIDKFLSRKTHKDDCLDYLPSVVWDVLFSPTPPCTASFNQTFRMKVLEFLDMPNSRRTLIADLYEQNESIEEFIDSLPKESLLNQVFGETSMNRIYDLLFIARQTYSDHLRRSVAASSGSLTKAS